jgi:uncharacterized protein (TIRG00374 family)
MWQRLFFLLSMLLGIAGFCAIPFVVGVHDLLRTIGQVGWFCLVLFVVNASCTLLIPAVGWWLLLRAEHIPASLGTAVKANLMGFPLDFVVPSAYVGGEGLKAVYVASVCQVTRSRVLATIIVAKFQELGGLVLGMMVATAALVVWHTDAFTQRHIALFSTAIVLLSGLFGMLLYALVGRLQPVVRLCILLAQFRAVRPQMLRLRTFIEEVEERIHATFTQRLWVCLLAQIITCFSAVSVFIRPWIFFHALPNTAIGFDQLCALFVLTNLVNALTVVPGSLGFFEATMAGYAYAAGLGGDKGIAFALVNRVADLTLIVIGCWLIVYYGLSKVARGREAALQPSK